jgi:hypothetical protein
LSQARTHARGGLGALIDDRQHLLAHGVGDLRRQRAVGGAGEHAGRDHARRGARGERAAAVAPAASAASSPAGSAASVSSSPSTARSSRAVPAVSARVRPARPADGRLERCAS